jgi:hypothetical protein
MAAASTCAGHCGKAGTAVQLQLAVSQHCAAKRIDKLVVRVVEMVFAREVPLALTGPLIVGLICGQAEGVLVDQARRCSWWRSNAGRPPIGP